MIRKAIIYIGLMLWCTTHWGCKPQKECEPISSEASIFIGEWVWAYSIISSNLPEPSPNPVDNRDTITPSSSGKAVLIRIRKDGSITVKIGQNENCYCMGELTLEQENPGQAGNCSSLIRYNYVGSETHLRTGAIIDCNTPNEMWGTGYPHGTGLPPPDPIPIQELLPGFEVTEMQSFYSRMH